MKLGITGAVIALGVGLLGMVQAAFAQSVVQVPGKPTLSQGAFDKAPPGYVIEEFFVSGVGQRVGPAPAAATATAPYTTRIVVVRPTSAKRFNGTAVVEWLNVSAGTDGAPDWTYLHRELVRQGYAWIGVSAQKVGIEGSPRAMPGMLPLKQANAARYAPLAHPGDAFSYDIFRQVGRAVRSKPGAAAMGGLAPRIVLATGESQSAGYLTTYINEVAAADGVFDGFLVHSRFGGAAPLDGDYTTSMQAMAAGKPLPPVLFRDQLAAPVLNVITETDLLMPLVGYLPARQPDNAKLRTWEIAGTAHADTYTLTAGMVDDGTATIEALARALAPTDQVMGMKLGVPMNAAPQHHYVMQAALDALNRWVKSGKAPPAADRLKVTEAKAFQLDANGNALGGIRSPWVDVPTAKLSGLGQTAPGLLALFGSTQTFPASRLNELYPGGRKEYLARFGVALRKAIGSGFILERDRQEIEALAAQIYPIAPAPDAHRHQD